MSIDLLSHHRHVKSLPLARRQVITSEEGQLQVDGFSPQEDVPEPPISETPTSGFVPESVPTPVIPNVPANAGGDPTLLATTLSVIMTPSASATPVPSQGVPEPLLGLDTNPDRPEIITILCGMSIISVFLVILLFIVPLFQSRRRRDNRLCYVSEDDPDTMSGLSRFGYTQYLDPPSPWQQSRKVDFSPPNVEQEDPMRRHRPPGLALGPMSNVPLAPPSPRSGGLPSNPRSGLPSAHAYGGFRDKSLRPMSGVVTWRVQEPMENYAFDMSRYSINANMAQPPAPTFSQSIRDSIVSHFSFGRRSHRSSGQITRGDMMQVNREYQGHYI